MMKIQTFKTIGLALLLSICSIQLSAQEPDCTFDYNADKTMLTITPHWDIDAMVEQDLKNEANGAPLRMARIIDMPLNMDTVGVWLQDAKDAKVWRFTISLPKSFGVIAYFDKFVLPAGSELYAYSEDKYGRTSKYVPSMNPNGGYYVVEVERGSQLTMEYIAPFDQEEKPTFVMSELAFKYRDLNEAFYTEESFLRVLNDHNNRCIPNINCPEGNDWQVQKKSVVRLRNKMGKYWYFCTGSLINNTREDKTPYVITADHCFNDGGATPNWAVSEFLFEYEHPGCENLLREPQGRLFIGAEPLVLIPLNGGSDGALVKMTKEIPDNLDVQFNGWTLEKGEGIFHDGSVVQHPEGDTKKIALYDKPLFSVTWMETGVVGATNAFWRVNYTPDKGVTQRGSSGSPLFNQEKLVIGTLTGGNSMCGSVGRPNTGQDAYGKFSAHWDEYSDPNQRMHIYLNPDNKSITKLQGFPYSNNKPEPPKGDDKQNIEVYRIDGDYQVQVTKKIEFLRVFNLRGDVLFQRKNIEDRVYILPLRSVAAGRGVHVLEIKLEGEKRKKIKIVL